jgi:hypothetical protein
MTDARGASLEVWDDVGGTPAAWRPPHEAWPELRLWDEESLWQEPWWNAGRRARLARRELYRKVQWIRISVFRRSAFLFFFLTFVAQSADRDGAGPTAGVI